MDHSDPLPIAAYRSWGAPVPSLPMVWTYGSSASMPFALPLALLAIPSPHPDKMEQVLPTTACNAILSHVGKDVHKLTIWAVIHAAPARAPCQKASHDMEGRASWEEVNLSHHAWLWPDLDTILAADPSASMTTTVQTGVFCTAGVEASHQELVCVEARGLAFDTLEPREVVVHDGGRFSPCNCMLRLLPDKIWHHFISVSLRGCSRFREDEVPAHTGQSKAAVVVLHVLPAHLEAQNRLQPMISAARELGQLCAALAAVDESAGDALIRLVDSCCGENLMAAVIPQRELLVAQLSQYPAILPWLPPGAVADVPLPDGEELMEKASRLLKLGYSNFDLNVEVLQSVGGDLDAAMSFLRPS